jgi:hypothetical protein
VSPELRRAKILKFKDVRKEKQIRPVLACFICSTGVARAAHDTTMATIVLIAARQEETTGKHESLQQGHHQRQIRTSTSRDLSNFTEWNDDDDF